MAESGGFWRATTANSPCSEPTSPDRKPLLRNVVSPPSQAVAGDLRHRQMDGGPPFFTDLGRCEFRPGRQNNPVGPSTLCRTSPQRETLEADLASLGNLPAWGPVHRSRIVGESLRLAASARWRSISYSTHINYMPHFHIESRGQAVLSLNRGRKVIRTSDLNSSTGPLESSSQGDWTLGNLGLLEKMPAMASEPG